MKLSQMSPLPAYEDVMRLLRILAEPDLAREQLEAIEAARQAANKAVGDVKRLSAVDALEDAARTDRQTAAKALQDAQAEATRTLDAARADIDAARAKLKADLTKGHATLRAHEDKAAALTAALTAREADLRAREERVSAREDAASKLEAAALALKADYTQKLAALKAAVG